MILASLQVRSSIVVASTSQPKVSTGHASARISIAQPHAQGQAAIATDAQTQQHLLEITPVVFAMAIGGARSPRIRSPLVIRTVEGDRRRIVMNPVGLSK
jgi:hypothetical protein